MHKMEVGERGPQGRGETPAMQAVAEKIISRAEYGTPKP